MRAPVGNLDILGVSLADIEAVLALHVASERIVKLVTRHLDGVGNHGGSVRNHRDVGRAAADIEHHVPRWLVDVEPGSDGSRNRLLD